MFLKTKKTLFNVIRADGLVLGGMLLLTRIFYKIRSYFFSKLLSAKKINLGNGCQFFGTKFIQFGEGISVHKNLWLEAVSEYAGQQYSPIIVFGDRVKMSDGVHITSINEIRIGNDVLFGSNVYVSDHNHGKYSGTDVPQSPPNQPPSERRLHSNGPVIIESNVWIGDNVNIVGPLKIGYGSIVAANSVVRKDIPPRVIVAGSPACIIKKFNDLTKAWEKY